MQFHDLQSNIPEVKADKELYTVFKKVQKVLTEMMKEKCPSEEDLMELYGKIVVNCHQPYIGQFGCGILKMVGPKMQDFCPNMNMLKGFFKQSCNELWFIKKCRNCTFKANFLCQKLVLSKTNEIKKKNHLRISI